MLLDEWAANQDPSFRWIFYGEILPDLKRQGRTLIATRPTIAISARPTVISGWKTAAS
jgi:hypothetical protein